MASRTDAAGTTGYTYDGNDRLSSQSDAASGTTQAYTYNSLNQVASITYSSGDVKTYSYDALHRVTSEALATSSGTAVASISYGYDNNDNLTSKTTAGIGTGSASSSIANTYAYDEAGRLTSWTATPSSTGTASTTGYTYDADGNLTAKGSTAYTYNAQDELTSNGTSSYTYAADGDLTSSTTTAGVESGYTTDAFGTQVTAGAETYTTDALGRIVAATENTTSGGTDTLTYAGGSDQVTSDGSASYSYDPDGDITGVEDAGATSGQVAWTDQHGDLVASYGSAAASLSTWTVYDPWGKVASDSGTQTQVGYQGQWTDPVTGQVAMGSRFYNPGTSSFDDRDTVWDSLDDGASIDEGDAYAYVLDDPLTGTDTSGECWVCWSAVVSVVHHVAHAANRAYHAVTRTVAHVVAKAAATVTRVVARVYHTAVNAVHDAARAVVHRVRRAWRAAVRTVRTAWRATTRYVKSAYHYAARHAARAYNYVKREARAMARHVAHAVRAAAHYVARHAHAMLRTVAKVAAKVAQVANVVAMAAPVLSIVAAATAAIPVLDVVTSGLAAGAEAAVVIGRVAGAISAAATTADDITSGKSWKQDALDGADAAMQIAGGGAASEETTAVSAVEEDATNWSSKGVKTFGHTFNKHGMGAKNLKSLTDTARSTGDEQGQWLDNEAAAKVLRDAWDPENMSARTIDIPEGVGQVIQPDGNIVSTTSAIIVPRRGGVYRTAYPVSESSQG